MRLLVALHPVPDRPEVVRSLVGGALGYLEGAGPPVPLQQHQVPEEGGVGAVGVVEVLPQLLGRVVEPDVNRVLVRLVHHVDLAQLPVLVVVVAVVVSLARVVDPLRRAPVLLGVGGLGVGVTSGGGPATAPTSLVAALALFVLPLAAGPRTGAPSVV